jgi:uncharacterized protein (DUF2126 family)/transglutaminase-like putative cysteine protease
MSIHVALNHVTHYQYDRPVSLGPQIIRLRPAPHSRTPILSYSLTVSPPNHFINWQQDPQGNFLARLVFPEKARELKIEVDLVAEMSVINPFDFFLEPEAEHFPFKYDDALLHELAPYLVTIPLTPRFGARLDAIPRAQCRSIDFLVDLNRRLQQEVGYVIRMEPGIQTPEETLALGSGSCRDSAWLEIQLLRHLGIAARFVSGYLVQLVPDVKSLDGPSGPAADFTDLHAWCEVYLPGAGWIGLDATSGLLAGEGHIPLACTPHPQSAAPLTGYTDECECTFSHAMHIARVRETPRVTRPYSEREWRAITQLGHSLDARLIDDDVRLTMGGEPTFVSADDRDGAEWNTTALGPGKRRVGADLLARLKARHAPHGLLHYGQGKWYPGEQLPRWSLNLFWRKDGEPIWNDNTWYADETKPLGATDTLAAAFLRELSARLALDPRHVFPAYEDVWYYLWRERKLPVNVDPLDARLNDPLERERLRKVFGQGLDRVVGHVLPIQRADYGGARWQTGPWFLRAERCYLVPGDSPLGYRLPLDSQPWAAEADYPYIHMQDPHQAFTPLQAYRRILAQLPEYQRASDGAPAHEGSTRSSSDSRRVGADARGRAERPMPFQSAEWITRTAICAEPRDGTMYIFMPPTRALEDYLELVAAVESTAATLKCPVVLEGYEPPRDPRLETLRVTPDPGVIEVNVQPVSSWDQLVDNTTFLYEAAHASRLSAEKFMLDGRHSGTGGGNHIVLGGPTPADSPFLRRPDLLASLIGYWHNHPSLSYLFSGLFIGPTSQAPRIDEARNDSLREMELAFGELARQMSGCAGDTAPAPWLVDRIFRNLLIDVTGNTHRTELCIDKLYSPDGPSGRLGLLEMRAFEMPPHARMSAAQQLLLRALVARFWRTPYQPTHLQRWGTELHDRFMLPHFVWDDFTDVIEDLVAAGLVFDAGWYLPHREFRFPRLGGFAARGVDVELRAALEPWHVLGEEGAIGGTVRYVDSSLERLQVKATGLIGDRHVLTCNGKALPLQPTGTVGEFVAGVRYRAWQPAASLHPTIPVDTPLVFDLVDTWMGRSLGGARYHVAHPGGRNYETFPVNAFEAEARRLARFSTGGYTPRQDAEVDALGQPARESEFPFTLDLRHKR